MITRANLLVLLMLLSNLVQVGCKRQNPSPEHAQEDGSQGDLEAEEPDSALPPQVNVGVKEDNEALNDQAEPEVLSGKANIEKRLPQFNEPISRGLTPTPIPPKNDPEPTENSESEADPETVPASGGPTNGPTDVPTNTNFSSAPPFGSMDPVNGNELAEELWTEFSSCGDGIVNAKEQCDPGIPHIGAGCNSYCTYATCGNGITEHFNNEQCDDGNEINNDGCDNRCLFEVCGNCKLDIFQYNNMPAPVAEQCDEGVRGVRHGCERCCKFAGDCPDGIEDPYEQCGHFEKGCSRCCLYQKCGNGIVDPTEQCDAGANNGVACFNCSCDCQFLWCPVGSTSGSTVCLNPTAAPAGGL